MDITESKIVGSLVEVVTNMVNRHDPAAAGHQEEVALLAKCIAETMGQDRELVNCVFMAAQMHDVGKIAIPAEVLSYPGKLTNLQQMMVRCHPQVSYEILGPISFPWRLADVVYQHHERLDGSGYPRGLAGNQILMEARILAVADVVQAMITNRTYHAPFGVDNIIEELESHKGVLYDADVVNTYKKLVTDKGYMGSLPKRVASSNN